MVNASITSSTQKQNILINGFKSKDPHAIIGSFSLLLHIILLIKVHDSSILIILGVILSTILTFTSYPLVPKAPLVTKIYHSIHAPHRDAFRRTISMIHYINMRIMLELFQIDNFYTKIFLFCYAIYSFLPSSKAIDDGNTWFFGVPMCTSCVLDSLFIYNTVNHHIISLEFLNIVQICAHLIAFAFTLAFRKTLNIIATYFVSVLIVGALFSHVVSSLYMQNNINIDLNISSFDSSSSSDSIIGYYYPSWIDGFMNSFIIFNYNKLD